MRNALHVRKARFRYPYATIRQLAEHISTKKYYKGTISYQRVYQCLVEEGLETSPPRSRKTKYCRYYACGEAVERIKTFCSNKHRFYHYNIKVICGYCTLPFYRKRAILVSNKRYGAKNAYCTIKCFRRDREIVDDDYKRRTD